MDWKQLIEDLQQRNVTLDQIAKACEFAGRPAVHNLKSRGGSCSYERGVKLVALHRKVMRRKVKP